MSNGYQINEKDIDGVLNYLIPRNGYNPELFESERQVVRPQSRMTCRRAHTDLSKLEEIYEEFKREKTSKS